MLKLLEFVEKSDTAKKIKGENNDAIKNMRARIKELLPGIIKKKENDERAQDWGEKVNKSASSRRRRYAKTNSHNLDIGKGTRTVSPPPGEKTEVRRASSILGDDPTYLEIKAAKAAAQAKYNLAIAELDKSPLHDEISAFLAAEGTHLMPNKLVKQKIGEIIDEATRKKKMDDLTRKIHSRKIQAAFRSWIQLKKAKEEQRRAAAITKIQAAQRRKAAKAKVNEMRATADRDAGRTLVELEEEMADEDEGEPDDEFVTTAPIDVAINQWSNGDFEIKKTNDDGDCLFEAFAYQLHRNGSAAIEYLDKYEDEYGRFPEISEWPFTAKSDRKQGVNILRRILANGVGNNWYPEDFAEEPGKNYMDGLSKRVNDGNLYDSRIDYLKHMTSPNLEKALVKLEHNYKPKGRFGSRPELLEFQTLFGTKIQIIVASMVEDNTTLEFKGYPRPQFQVIKDKIYDTDNVLTLIFYVTTGNRDDASVSASHYEIIALTEEGERKKNVRLMSAVSTDIDEGKSSAAPAISSKERKNGDCVKYTYPDGGVVRGIIIRDEKGIKIKGLYVDKDGKKILGTTPGAFSDYALSQIEDWNPTRKKLEEFYENINALKEEYKELNKTYKGTNASIDSMLNLQTVPAKDSIKKHLTKIVGLNDKIQDRRKKAKTTRNDKLVQTWTVEARGWKNLVKKYIKTKESGKNDDMLKKTVKNLVTLWSARTSMQKVAIKVNSKLKREIKFMNEMEPMLERCIKRKGGKRKRKTKRKRRKRKKKKSTRRKRRR